MWVISYAGYLELPEIGVYEVEPLCSRFKEGLREGNSSVWSGN